MASPRMTLNEVYVDMRERGMRCSPKTIADGIESGYFPFGKVISKSPTGQRNIIIMRRDYESWADEYLN